MVVGVLATRREPDRLLRTKPSRRLGVHRPQSLSGIDYSYYYKYKNEKGLLHTNVYSYMVDIR